MNTPLSAVNLKLAINNLDSLPAMPVIAQKLLGLDLDSVAGERDLLKLIEQDPQISAKIIGLSNSALFGASKRVTSVQDAAILLGLTRVKSVTLGIALMTALIKKPSGQLDMQALWLHSLSVSLALRTLAQAMPRHTRPLDDEIFLAGLLHDIGFLVLNHLDQTRSDELHSRFAADSSRPIEALEAEMLELNHAELGAELARYWDLPDAIVAMIRYHHTPELEAADIGQPLVSMVNLAEKMLTEYGLPNHETPVVSDDEWLALGIAPSRAKELWEKINEQVLAAKAAGISFS
jgi:putative nucleotidyltransferase with HDIG domain